MLSSLRRSFLSSTTSHEPRRVLSRSLLLAVGSSSSRVHLDPFRSYNFQTNFIPRRTYSNNDNESPEPDSTEGEANIRKKLKARFSPLELQVKDISGGCGTFYAISITSQAFKGLSIVKQHKLITEELKKEIEGIHGLQIKTKIG